MTIPPAPLVLVTRPPTDARRTAGALAARGWTPLIDPLMRVVDLPDSPVPALAPQAWLLTSANGVAALAARLRAAGRPLTGVPLLAVGGRTAAAARREGFLPVLDADGDAQALTTLAADHLHPGAGPLIHAAGEDVAGDLAGPLTAQGYTVRRLTLYRMEAATTLAATTIEALRRGDGEGRVAAVLLFSPRSARTFVSLAAQAGLAPCLARMAALCLSPAVADAVARTLAVLAPGADFASVRVAARPREDALLDLLGTPVGPGAVQPGPADKRGPEDEGEPAQMTDAHMPDPAGESPAPERDADHRPAIGEGEADRLIERFGGIRPMAAKLGIPVTTVQGWKKRGHIPDNRRADILAAAARLGLPPDDASSAGTGEPSSRSGGFHDTAPSVPPPGASPAVQQPAGSQAVPAGAMVSPSPSPSAAPGVPPPSGPRLRVPAADRSTNIVTAKQRSGRGLGWLALLVAVAGAAGNAGWTAYQAGDLDALTTRLGLPARGDAGAAHLLALDTGIARLAQRQGEQARALEDLAAKMAALEHLAVSAPSPSTQAPPTQGRADGVTTEDIKAQEGRIDDLAQQLARLGERQHALEQALTTLQGEASQAGQQVGRQMRAQILADERAAGTARALVLAMGQLRDAVEEGRPYAAELAGVRALLDTPSLSPAGTPDTASSSPASPVAVAALLAPLATRADTGLPTLAGLRAGFDAAAAAAVAADAQAPDLPWWQRLLGRLGAVVTVRHKDGRVAGDGADAVTDRAAARLAAGDLRGAVDQLAALGPRAAQAPALAGWLAGARARLGAEDALERLRRLAIAGLVPAPLPAPAPDSGGGHP